MSTEYMRLIGAEDVRSAANRMQQAANDIRQAVGRMEESLEKIAEAARRLLDNRPDDDEIRAAIRHEAAIDKIAEAARRLLDNRPDDDEIRAAIRSAYENAPDEQGVGRLREDTEGAVGTAHQRAAVNAEKCRIACEERDALVWRVAELEGLLRRFRRKFAGAQGFDTSHGEIADYIVPRIDAALGEEAKHGA